jgi:hypothetical protein
VHAELVKFLWAEQIVTMHTKLFKH